MSVYLTTMSGVTTQAAENESHCYPQVDNSYSPESQFSITKLQKTCLRRYFYGRTNSSIELHLYFLSSLPLIHLKFVIYFIYSEQCLDFKEQSQQHESLLL